MIIVASSTATHLTLSLCFFLVRKPRSLGTLGFLVSVFLLGSACSHKVAEWVVRVAMRVTAKVTASVTASDSAMNTRERSVVWEWHGFMKPVLGAQVRTEPQRYGTGTPRVTRAGTWP